MNAATPPDAPATPAAAPLFGLVLAGGESRRMGRDKGSLVYHGEPQAVRAWRLLTQVCGRAYVSVNARHASVAPYADLPLIVDEDAAARGPAAGLAAAWRRHPDAAWLALAVDMPLVDADLLGELVAARDRTAIATAFRGPDSIQPLAAIYEPAARERLLAQVAAGDGSPRRLLERRAALVAPSTPWKLRSVDRLDEYGVLAGRPM